MTESTTENSCLNCRFAEWERTKVGRLHSNEDGRCGWKIPYLKILLPKAFYFSRSVERPFGGGINQIDPYTECPTWEEKTNGNNTS